MDRRSNQTKPSLSGVNSRPSFVILGCIVVVLVGVGVVFTALHRSATPVAVGPAVPRQNTDPTRANTPNSSGGGHVKPGAGKPRDPGQSPKPVQKAE